MLGGDTDPKEGRRLPRYRTCGGDVEGSGGDY